MSSKALRTLKPKSDKDEQNFVKYGLPQIVSGIEAQLKKSTERNEELDKENKYLDLSIDIINFFINTLKKDKFSASKLKRKLLSEHNLEPYNPDIDYSKYKAETFINEYLKGEEQKEEQKEEPKPPRTTMSTMKEVPYKPKTAMSTMKEVPYKPRTAMSTMKEVPYKPRTAMSTTKTVEQSKALLEKDVDKINKDVDKLIEKVSGSVRLTKEQVYQHYKQHGTLPLTAKGKPYKIDIEKYEAKHHKPKRIKKQDKALPMSTTKEVVYHKEKKGRITPQEIYEHYKQHGTVPLTARGTPYKFDVQKYEEKQRREKARLAKGGKRKLTKEQQEEYKRIQEENAKKPKKPDYDYNFNIIDINAIPRTKPKPTESKFTSPEYKEFTKKMDSNVDSFVSNYLDMERARSKDEKEFYTEMFKEKGEKLKSGLQTKLATNEWKQEWLDKHGDNLYEALKKLKTMS